MSDKTLLIVDDEVNYVIILSKILERYNILSATSGTEALELLKSGGKPDLILMDIDMPGMSGFELAGSIRKDYPSITAPIIFVSARSDLDSYVEGFEIGADEYITKPFEREKVVQLVNEKLNPEL